MKHRLRPFQSLILLAWDMRHAVEEISALAERARHEDAVEFAERVSTGMFDEVAESSKDKNFFSGFYIETE